jgi:spore maturation protein CgeB
MPFVSTCSISTIFCKKILVFSSNKRAHREQASKVQMNKKSVILYIIGIDPPPHYVIRKAFQSRFEVVYDFDWLNIYHQIGLQAMQQQFLELLKSFKPDYCFMQVQNPGAMDVLTIREMAKYTKIIHWSGDVRDSPGWYNWIASLGREVHLTVLCNETDVERVRELGVNAAYLQIGFDNVYYQRRERIEGWPEIVFAANNHDIFELSAYRAETVLALYEAFPSRFQVFGNGWEKYGIHTQWLNNSLEAECYNSCKIALSISNFQYKRYYSDRLLRIMACGCCPISHWFPNLENDFTPGYNIVTFSDHKELIEKCNHYLEQDNERKEIGDNAFDTAHTKCTWDVRCEELLGLLNASG